MNVVTWESIAIIAGFITAIDLILFRNYGYKGTISGQIYLMSRKYHHFLEVLVVYGLGVLTGHFFFPPPCPEISTGNREAINSALKQTTGKDNNYDDSSKALWQPTRLDSSGAP